MKQEGFSLVEMVIYIGIIGFIVVATLSFTLILVNDQIKQNVVTEVYEQGNFSFSTIEYRGVRATSIGGATVYGTNPGTLVLNYFSNPTVTIDTYTKQVTRGSQSYQITKLRFQEGANPAEDLTSDQINVTNFLVTNRSQGSGETIEITLGLEFLNPSNSKAYESQQTWNETITLR